MKNILNFCMVLLVLLTKTPTAYSQNYLPYYRQINQAEIFNHNGQYAQADSIYQLAFSLVPKGQKHDYKQASINATQVGDKKKAVRYLDSAIVKGLNMEQIARIDLFKEYLSEITPKYVILREKYESSLNKSIIDTLKKLAIEDDRYRTTMELFISSFDKVAPIDSANFYKIKELTEQYGWLGFSIVGDDTDEKTEFSMVRNMIVHFDPLHKRFFLNYVHEAVLRGEAYPFEAAHATDRLRIDEVKPQYYGSINGRFPGGKFLVFPLDTDDISEIDRRRYEIGLDGFLFNKMKAKCTYDPSYTFEIFQQETGHYIKDKK